MNATNRLRFVERKVELHPFYVAVDSRGNTSTYQTIRVLQQWLEDSVGDMQQGVTAFGKWRDVPLEEEK